MSGLRDAALDVANAVNALRLKGARLIGQPDGVIIQQRGKPDLLLTADAARRFRQEQDEAGHD